MKSQKETNSLEGILIHSNDEIIANWSRLASLIKLNEQVQWVSARKKASELIKESHALEYVLQVRGSIHQKTIETKNEMTPQNESVKSLSSKKLGFQQNYKRFLEIAPSIEERILKAGNRVLSDIQGLSKITAYPTLELFIFAHFDDDYYLKLISSSKKGNLTVLYPQMEFIFNPIKQTLEAISFENGDDYTSVYIDPFERTHINLKESKIQNRFLGEWLVKLQKQKQRIIWNSPITKSYPLIPKIDDEEQLEDQVEYDFDIQDSPKTARWNKLLALIIENENCRLHVAEYKAEDLIENRRDLDYLIDCHQNNVKFHLDELQKINFQFLKECIPNFETRLNHRSIDCTLQPTKKGLNSYKIVQGEKLSNSIHQLTILETVERKGTMTIAVDTEQKKVWLLNRTNSFNGKSNYEHTSTVDEEHLLFPTMEKEVKKWLCFITDNDINYRPMGYFSDPAIQPIPVFESGQVILTKTHEDLGLTQKHVDWINKHKQGMIITPRKYPKGKEPANYVKRSGFRISRIGMVYFEGISSRTK